MSEESLHSHGDLTTVIVHDQQGRPLLLRHKFIIAVHFPYGQDFGKVQVDDGNARTTLLIQDKIDDIESGFIRDDNLLINPAYLKRVEPYDPEEGVDNKKGYEWCVRLAGPGNGVFFTHAAPAFYADALRKIKGFTP